MLFKSKPKNNSKLPSELGTNQPPAEFPISEKIEETATPVDVVKPKGLFSFTKKSPELAEPSVELQKSDKKGFWSFGKKASQESNPDKATAKPKPTSFFSRSKEAAKKSGLFSFSNEFYFLTELDNGKELFWKLTENDLVRAEETDSPNWGTFSAFDLRFKTPKSFRLKDCLDLAMAEEGEFVHIVNASSELKVFYATRTTRSETKEYRIGPAQLLVDYALTKKKLENKTRVILVHLEGVENSVVVLYAMDEEGETRKPQITLNPENNEFVLSQFMATRKLDKTKTEIITLTNADILQVSSNLRVYPNEPQAWGIPVRKWQAYGLTASFLLAIAGGGLLGYSHFKLLDLTNQVAATKKNMVDTQSQISQKIETSIYSFAKAMSLDYKESFKKASLVWVPDSYVELKSDYTNDQFIVHMLFNKNTVFGNKPSTEAILPVDSIRKLLAVKLPEECEQSDISLTGALNEFQVTVNCKNTNSSFSDFRNK